jgi:hypothetical protein
VPAPHLTNVPDRVFVIRATLGGAAEIELARLAEQKTRNISPWPVTCWTGFQCRTRR